MAKVLISFLGTGRFEPRGNIRSYNKVRYNLNNSDLGEYSFLSAALKDYHRIDKMLLIGTVHSMWEEVYMHFSKEKLDENVYEDIARNCEKANNNSPLVIPHKEIIEQTLGKGSKVVLIKYGITESEIMQNINIILGLQNFLNDNDELIIDITHSFRSLPIFMMNLLIYLQNVSPKHITISHIYYGMLEIARELHYAPVVDLKAIMKVQNWITGAYAFSTFGNTYKISELLQEENKSVAPILRDFSDAMNLNYLYSMRAETQKLAGIKNKDYTTDLPKQIISPIVNKFVETFTINNATHQQSLYQLKLSKWQFEHKKYAQAYMTSNDALITYVCELNGLEWDNYDDRESAKTSLRRKNEAIFDVTDEMYNWFKSHNVRRNGIAHTTKVHIHGKEMKSKEMINFLEKDLKELTNIIK